MIIFSQTYKNTQNNPFLKQFVDDNIQSIKRALNGT